MSAAGIYVHIPFCRSKCAYCDFVSICEGEEKQREYINALLREINTGRKIFSGEADTLYIGGGTPSCLFKGAVKEIADAVISTFKCDIKEFTAECNPDTFDDEKADELKEAGVTRISLGVQSLSDKVLKAIGRRHDSAAAKEAVKRAVGHGFDVSADLMLGLEGQSGDDVKEFVSFIAGEGVEHVSAYMLKVEKGTPLEKRVREGLVLPTDDDCARLYDTAYDALSAHGFRRYETSNFCKKGKVCMHNMKYWAMADYLAFGVAAHGKIGKLRYYNISDIDSYIARINSDSHRYETEEELTEEEERSETLMLGLRLEDGVNVKELEKRYGIDFEKEYSSALGKTAPYVLFDGNTLRIRPEYALVANAVIEEFI